MTKNSLRARLIFGAILIPMPIVMGAIGASPYNIFILAILFSIFMTVGRIEVHRKNSPLYSRKDWIRLGSQTLITQLILTTILFLLGLGGSAIFGSRIGSMAIERLDLLIMSGFSLLLLPMMISIYRQEHRKGVKKNQGSLVRASGFTTAEDLLDVNDDISGDSADAQDGNIIPAPLTLNNFYRGFHFSESNPVRWALKDERDANGDKYKRYPIGASEARIAETEKRLGFRLPETLRALYKIRDGGSVPDRLVRISDDPIDEYGDEYDNFFGAFADDYNVLNGLAELETLRDNYLEYDSEEDSEDWIEKSERYVYLAMRMTRGTALDYSQCGDQDEPGVAMFDTENGKDKAILAHFDSFDEFLAACHKYVDRDRGFNDVVFGDPPNPSFADEFWGDAGNPTETPITEESWADASYRLGVILPSELLPFYKAADGGTTEFNVALKASGNPSDPPRHVFPKGPYVAEGLLLPLSQWISLKDLSDRLEFVDGAIPWTESFEHPEKLIVISASFYGMILLDYRESETPEVLSIAQMETPDKHHKFESVAHFLGQLRQYGNPEQAAKNKISDNRLSAQSPLATNFWLPNDRGPAAPKMFEKIERHIKPDHRGLPNALKSIYQVQNGGRVRFRWVPPRYINANGYVNEKNDAAHWVDAFPYGLWPIEEWMPFKDWCEQSEVARQQDIFEFLNNIDKLDDKDNDNLSLWIIGGYEQDDLLRITLLDLSRDFFNSNSHLMSADYDFEKDRFDVIWGPILVDNVYSGLMQSVRALKEEL